MLIIRPYIPFAYPAWPSPEKTSTSPPKACTGPSRRARRSASSRSLLNHPATAVAWLANKIAPHGLALEPGQVVLAGSFIRPIETRKGDTIQADYGTFGSVSCYFA
jgi:2-keto-4-pentenoate hydratase